MSQENLHDPFPAGDQGLGSDQAPADPLQDELLPTICLLQVPHETIPNLYQYCYEYVERWQWSPKAELVETGRWFFGPPREDC